MKLTPEDIAIQNRLEWLMLDQEKLCPATQTALSEHALSYTMAILVNTLKPANRLPN